MKSLIRPYFKKIEKKVMKMVRNSNENVVVLKSVRRIFSNYSKFELEDDRGCEFSIRKVHLRARRVYERLLASNLI